MTVCTDWFQGKKVIFTPDGNGFYTAKLYIRNGFYWNFTQQRDGLLPQQASYYINCCRAKNMIVKVF